MITSVIIICFMTSYDAHLSHCAYTIVICSVFNIMLRVLQFYQWKMKWAFIITIGVTMKAAAFEDYGFVKLVLIIYFLD